MSISEQIETIIRSMTDNNHPPQVVTITKAYDDLLCDINTLNGKIERVRCSGKAEVGEEALLTYDGGDPNKPFVLLFNSNGSGGAETTSDLIEESALPHLGTSAGANQHQINLKIDEKINQGGGGSIISVGSFSINSNGHLIVELPGATDNPYYIDNNGHLIYDTTNTHNMED